MGDGGARVQVTGLVDLVRELKGPAFKDVNFALRESARPISESMVPLVAAAVRQSAAPQAPAMAATIRAVRDRVPVVAMGRVNPKFNSHPFTHKGESAFQRKRRRGALALGVVKGPHGGRRDTAASENYYRVPRSETWGPLGVALRGGILREAELRYRLAFMQVLAAHGFDTRGGRR